MVEGRSGVPICYLSCTNNGFQLYVCRSECSESGRIALALATCFPHEVAPFEQELCCLSLCTVTKKCWKSWLFGRKGWPLCCKEVGEVALIECVGTDPGVGVLRSCKQLGVLQADTLCERLAKPHNHTPAHKQLDVQLMDEGAELPG